MVFAFAGDSTITSLRPPDRTAGPDVDNLDEDRLFDALLRALEAGFVELLVDLVAAVPRVVRS
jgi:hypothetical protein